MKKDDAIYEGSCCCGRVRFTVRPPFGTFSHCHCTDCRKSHGAAFATYVGVDRPRLAFLQGEGEIAGFTTGTGTRRNFCRHCGSTLTCTVPSEPDEVYLAAATLDTPIPLKPVYHIFVRSQVPWLELKDGLPRHREYPEE